MCARPDPPWAGQERLFPEAKADAGLPFAADLKGRWTRAYNFRAGTFRPVVAQTAANGDLLACVGIQRIETARFDLHAVAVVCFSVAWN